MNNNSSSRNRFTHLYDPKKEGLGLYDINYINASKREKKINCIQNIDGQERYAA